MTDTLSITLAQLNQSVGDIPGNAARMLEVRARARDSDLVVFPEMQLIGYPPEDLVLKPALIERAAAQLDTMAQATADGGPAMLVGSVFVVDGNLHNGVALLDQLGTPYRQLEQDGFLLPVLETGLTYHRPSHFDDRVKITVTLAEKPRARLRLTYQVTRGEELLVEGFTVHAFVNRDFKAIRPPDLVEAALAQAFGPA